MGIIDTGKIVMIGNFTKAKRYKNGKPKDWIDRDWKAIIPYPFKWRTRLGKVKCDCKEVIESYQPYYGSIWTHSEECSMMKHLNKYPQIHNLIQVSNVIAQTD